jgi:hypothetical protein
MLYRAANRWRIAAAIHIVVIAAELILGQP